MTADYLGISAGSIRCHLARARRHLRSVLDERTSDTRIVRDVLATMIAEAPPPVDLEGLAVARVVPEPHRSRRSSLTVVVAGFVVIAVTLGGIFTITQRSTPVTGSDNPASDATIFMIPGFIPEGLELVRAEVDSHRDLTHQVYLEEGIAFSEVGSSVGGEQSLEIIVTDRAKQLADAGSDEDPTIDLRAYRDAFQESNPHHTLDEILIRGRPTLVIEQVQMRSESNHEAPVFVTTLLILEGEGIYSQLISEQLSRATVIADAESLAPTSRAAFDQQVP